MSTGDLKRIRILPPQLVNRIAAGEVVERPASVVKELVENALDAGATRVDITAGAGGRNIRVADNGHGMDEENARLAFHNHATSKIADAADLDRIETLGFRGEALASIASISRFTCITRTRDAVSGIRVTFDEAGNPQLKEAGCAPGTVMEVSDLFYNTPARLKFLKRPATETGHIEETVQQLALSHPHVQFSLTLNDKNVLKTSGSGDLKRAIDEVFRFEDARLIPVEFEDAEAGYRLSGFVSEPGVLKSSKRWLVQFVNRRWVRCPMLAKATEAAYESLIPQGKYPVAILFLTIPAEEVDVNVHPTKREVRYAAGQTMFSFVMQGIRASMERAGVSVMPSMPEPVPVTSLPSSPGWSSGRPATSTGGGGYRPNPGMSRPVDRGLNQALNKTWFDAQEPLPVQMSLSEPSSPPLQEQAADNRFKVIGQLFNTYILLETVQGLMVVDQHIASERTFFEALTLALTADTPPSQQLLASALVPVTPTQRELLQANREAFLKLGFDYGLDGNAVQLTAVPLVYQGRDGLDRPGGLFEHLVAQLEETGQMKLDLDHMIATLSCHSAVRAGDVLDEFEMTEIVRQWLACKLPWTCPHGRPIAHTISKQELNKFFDRPSLPVNA